MTPIERLGLAAIRRLDPERAHDVALRALRWGLTPKPGPVTSARLKCSLAGIDLPNPIGLAAGFDKNARAFAALLQTGFGFVEVGAATPRPQPGNPKPRLFRLDHDRAAINRFGFNNDGADAICARLAGRPATGVVGLNLGANKDSDDRAGDFATVLTRAAAHVDFVTVNVSSPNTERLRDLQGAAALDALLARVMAARNAARPGLPVFLKVAPDLNDAEIADIAALAVSHRLDALIATNTTLSRDGLTDPAAAQSGGLSGVPLFAKSTRVLARFAHALDGRLPLIGVGGITTPGDALAKIEAGAAAVQFYTALVFNGFSHAATLARGLDTLLAERGYANVAEAVGRKTEDWL